MSEITQETIDALEVSVRAVTPSGRMAEVDADIKAQVHQPLDIRAGFLRRLIDTFQDADPALAKYQAVTKSASDGRKRPAKSNPWSKEGWNVSAQGRLVLSMGETKAAQIAEAAGCKIGSTKFNPDYV
jgi:hypothetical protein